MTRYSLGLYVGIGERWPHSCSSLLWYIPKLLA